jgi:sec-independent protein translocase protein TatA
MDIGWPEILIIAAVVLVLFGSKKLPDAARSLGKSMRILKTEVKGMHDDDAAATTQPPAAQPPVALPPAGAGADVASGTVPRVEQQEPR